MSHFVDKHFLDLSTPPPAITFCLAKKVVAFARYRLQVCETCRNVSLLY